MQSSIKGFGAGTVVTGILMTTTMAVVGWAGVQVQEVPKLIVVIQNIENNTKKQTELLSTVVRQQSRAEAEREYIKNDVDLLKHKYFTYK